MAYSKELTEFILRTKGGFFLSPREELFLEFLEERGVPEEVVKEGLLSCLGEISPERRSKHPIFLCFKKVLEVYENFMKRQVISSPFDWQSQYRRKISVISRFIEPDVPEPDNEEEANRNLRELERELAKALWDKLPEGEKRKILRKANKFREDRELHLEVVKRYLFKHYGVPDLSLYSL